MCVIFHQFSQFTRKLERKPLQKGLNTLIVSMWVRMVSINRFYFSALPFTFRILNFRAISKRLAPNQMNHRAKMPKMFSVLRQLIFALIQRDSSNQIRDVSISQLPSKLPKMFSVFRQMGFTKTQQGNECRKFTFLLLKNGAFVLPIPYFFKCSVNKRSIDFASAQI